MLTFENYVKSEVEYEDGFLIDKYGTVLMSIYEEPIMKVAAEVVTQNGGDILNVGFGLGIVDHFIQLKTPNSHTIIEANNHIYREALKNGWNKNVELLHECWSVSIERFIKEGRKFDGIYYDIFNYNNANNLTKFTKNLKHILKKDGVFSFFLNENMENITEFVNTMANEKIFTSNGININVEYDDKKLENRNSYTILKNHTIPIVKFK